MTDQVIAERYALRELAGTGGMADVYRAADLVLEREVAVKLLRATACGAIERARFAGEARTLALLNHPGLVTVLDAGIEEERPYLVMELITGPTLAQHLSDVGPLDQEQTRILGAQLADALAYAHAHGVVHRDVKPSNILLRPDGSPVLTDFGIARLLTDAVAHTNTGDVIGSAAYLSPEQVNGATPTTAVDVYSLGLALLEALTGIRAYPGPPVEAAVARLSVQPPVPVSLDRDLRELLVRMTSLDPTDRPTAAEVAAATASHDGTAVMAAFDTEAADPAPSRRRAGLLVAAAVLGVAVLVAGVTQLRPDEVEAIPTGPTSSPSPSTTPVPTTNTRPAVATTPSASARPAPKAHKAKVEKAHGKPKKAKKEKGKGHGRK